MKVKQTEPIEQEIKRLEREHRRIHMDADLLEGKSYLTPKEERELLLLRKKKLKIKDHIAFLKQKIEEQKR